MITVKIGNEERRIADVTEQWVEEQRRRRAADGKGCCVEVLIKTHALDLRLATKDCQQHGGGSRPPNDAERHVIARWLEDHLDKADLSPGALQRFLHWLGRNT